MYFGKILKDIKMQEYKNKDYIAKKIKLARKQSNLTQQELAEKIGISSKQLSRIEIGAFMPSLITFLKIIDVLKIDIRDFGITINPTKNKLQNKLLKILYSSNDKELELYFDIISVLIKNSKKIKN